MNYVIYNASGEILRAGQCPEHAFSMQCGEGEFILEGEADPAKDSVDVATQAVVPNGRPVPPVPPEPYTVTRARMYPKIGDQLDMLWHAMDQNVLPRVEPFYSLNKAVKDAVPKPTSTG